MKRLACVASGMHFQRFFSNAKVQHYVPNKKSEIAVHYQIDRKKE